MRTTSTRQVTSLALWSGVLALTLLSPLSSSAADRNARVVSQPVLSWHKRFAAARTEARRRGVPLLVHFHASWCGPCRRMERDVLDTRQLASKLGSSVVAVKVDTDREPGVASRYRVRLLPTDLVLAPDGKQLFTADRNRLIDLSKQLVKTKHIAFGRSHGSIESTKIALRHTDIGVVDVSVDDIGDNSRGVTTSARLIS